MSIFSVTAIGGTGIGPVAAGWIAANPHLQWRWIQWLHAMYVPTTSSPTCAFLDAELLGIQRDRSFVRYHLRGHEGNPGDSDIDALGEEVTEGHQ